MTQPRRILISTDAVGGVWVYALELGRALSHRGVAVELAVLGPAPDARQRAAAAAAGLGLRETALGLDWTAPNPAALAEISAGLAALARDLRVDAVQLHTPALVGDVAWPAPVLAVVHSCLGTWWDAVRAGKPRPAEFEFAMAALTRGLGAADAVVAPTRALAAAVGRVYRTGRHIDVVHNGRAGIRGEAGLGDGVLAAGRLWDEAKNIALLDEAAASMDVPVSAAGALAGPNGAALAPRNLAILGLLDEAAMTAAMAGARIFASPALYEPFGLAVLEAAQAGRPLVLADIPTFRELWADAAIFLPAREARVWARTLNELHADPRACRRLGEAAQARAAAYSVARFAGAMWERLCRLTTAPCVTAA